MREHARLHLKANRQPLWFRTTTVERTPCRVTIESVMNSCLIVSQRPAVPCLSLCRTVLCALRWKKVGSAPFVPYWYRYRFTGTTWARIAILRIRIFRCTIYKVGCALPSIMDSPTVSPYPHMGCLVALQGWSFLPSWAFAPSVVWRSCSSKEVFVHLHSRHSCLAPLAACLDWRASCSDSRSPRLDSLVASEDCCSRSDSAPAVVLAVA